MNRVIRLDEPFSEKMTCAICGAEKGHRKQCTFVRGLICQEHCDECEYWDNTASIGICRYDKQEYDEIAALDHRQGMALCSCRMWCDRENGRYIIAVGRSSPNYYIYPADRPMEAVDCLLTEADGFAAMAAQVARRGHHADMLDIDMLESRGCAMRKLWDDLWEVRRVSLADDSVQREIHRDPLEAWRSFRDALRIRLQTAIENIQ